VRSHNWKAQATESIAKIFKGADLDITFNSLIRASIADIPKYKMSEVRTKYIERLAAILAAYRTHCAKTQATGQLILPEALRLLPIYSLSLLKSALLGY